MRGVLQHQETIEVRTPGRGFVELSREVAQVVAASRVRTGVALVFSTHTSAGLVIQENADPSVRRDFAAWLARLAPDGDPRYEHDEEGPDDMSAHLKSAVTRTSESIPIVDGRLALGTWQGLFLVEHRAAPHVRRLVVHVTGEP
ncbi:MAG: secondary thiamine-phosphate synthase enzyme YjbQ [Planctomycetes bacterium]|nr:secondary thiamine-phosphate synthase enzyme YjbQ [Planctomycetota bacterium]